MIKSFQEELPHMSAQREDAVALWGDATREERVKGQA